MNTKLNHIQDWAGAAKQSNWSVTKLADCCGVSSRTLERHFLKWTGKTAKQWLIEQRHTEAAKLIRQGLSVKEVAQQSGYRHASSFSREFNRYIRNYTAATITSSFNSPEQRPDVA